MIAGAACVFALIAVALGLRRCGSASNDLPPAESTALSEPDAAPVSQPGFLYGRVTAFDGSVHEGRLRWGGHQEAFWSDMFDGIKDENPWLSHLPPELQPHERPAFEILGFEFGSRAGGAKYRRRFMVRFGDISRIEPSGADVRVTLKSGAVFELDRLEASDFDDGVRVWDQAGGFKDLRDRRIRLIELLPTAPLANAPSRLHGTVRARGRGFTGFVEWNRTACLGSDEISGRGPDKDLSLRFDAVRSIARLPPDDVLITLHDGSEMSFSVVRARGQEHRGIVVDRHQGDRVSIPWDAFERVDFSERSGAGSSGPAYDDFVAGRSLTGSLTTRSGRLLTGRIVYDLDESETSETLDAPSGGVDHMIPFRLVASILLPVSDDEGGNAQVILHGGEELQLELAADLGPGNAGMLVFTDGAEAPEYVPWSDVSRIELDPPPPAAPEKEAGEFVETDERQ